MLRSYRSYTKKKTGQLAFLFASRSNSISDAGRPSITLISTMKQLILHHHDPSPFAEKIRLVFGRKIAVERNDAKLGDTVVPFPRIGYRVDAA